MKYVTTSTTIDYWLFRWIDSSCWSWEFCSRINNGVTKAFYKFYAILALILKLFQKWFSVIFWGFSNNKLCQKYNKCLNQWIRKYCFLEMLTSAKICWHFWHTSRGLEKPTCICRSDKLAQFRQKDQSLKIFVIRPPRALSFPLK